MKRQVIVVGAGPGGSTAAHFLAKAGVDVLLLEKEKFPRDKICGDGQVPNCHPLFKAMGIYDEIRQNASILHGTSIASCNQDLFSFTNPDDDTFATPRRIIDDIIRRSALAAGADYQENFEVTELITRRGSVVGVRGLYRGKPMQLQSEVVVVADGAHSRLSHQLGFYGEDPEWIFYGGRGYFDNVREMTDTIEFFYPHPMFFPAGYIWVFPLGGQRANVGIFITELALKKSGMRLEDFIPWWRDNTALGKLRMGEARLQGEFKGWRLPTWGMAKENYTGGAIVVGDAGNMIEPTFGGGLPHAMVAGMTGAQVLAAALKEGDVSAAKLKAYRDKVDELLGGGYALLTLLRRRLFTEPKDLDDFLAAVRQDSSLLGFSGSQAMIKYLNKYKDAGIATTGSAYSK